MAQTTVNTSDAADIMDEMFPAGFARGRRNTIPESALVIETFPLTIEHVKLAEAHLDSGQALGLVPSEIKALRHTHHRLAQLLAVGTDETVAAKLCNYSISRVSILKSAPAFRELLAHYASGVEDQWADFVGTAAGLSMDFLQELQRKLDETPEAFTPAAVMEAIKLLADRTGHAPISKTVNMNVNVDSAQRLNAARARRFAAQQLIEGDVGDE